MFWEREILYHFSKTLFKTGRICINRHKYLSISHSQTIYLDPCPKE